MDKYTTMAFEDDIRRLQAAKSDPEKLALATVDIVLSAHKPELKTALEAAAVPHWFDTKILKELLEVDEATASTFLGELQRLPMVESFATREGWNVHEASRLALRNRLASEEPLRLRTLSERAVECFKSDDPVWRVEAMYHQLVAAPEGAADQLKSLWGEWNKAGRYEQLQALSVVLDELLHTEQLAPLARAQSLLCFGWIRAATLPVRRAEELAREALRLFEKLGNESGKMDSRQQLGNALKTSGSLTEALRHYEAFQQIAKRLTQQDPDNADWQRGLSVSHSNVGSVYQAQGQLTEALREYEAYKQLMLRLTQQDPDNADWQRGLSVSHSNVGSVYQAQGQLTEALREYEAYKQLMLRLTQQDPDNADWQRGLSVSHSNVGSVYQAQGQLTEALREYEADKQLMLRLTQQDPDNADWQRDLSISHSNVGSVYQAQGQ